MATTSQSSAAGRSSRAQLRMVTCPGCGTKVFIPGDLPPLATTPCGKCGSDIMMPMKLRQFELRHAIASGGMGTVYRAWDTMLEREVAVKLMQPEVTDEETLGQFYREARACAALNHTNIIHIYTFSEHERLLYLAMELADNGSLDTRIESLRQVPELDVLDVGVAMASALDSALKKGLLHRDIKPGNILFNAENESKLIDFGLARSAEEDVETGASIWGTPYYIAPEKINQEREDFLSDMYSLAGTLYHALTGRVPFEAPTIDEVVAAHVQTPVTPPHHVVPHVTQPTSDAIVRALEKDPANRFQSYDEFVMALTAARSQFLVNHFNNTAGNRSAAAPDPGKAWWKK